MSAEGEWKRTNDRLLHRANVLLVAALCVFAFAVGVFCGGWPYRDPQEPRTTLTVVPFAATVGALLFVESLAVVERANRLLRERSEELRRRYERLRHA